MAHQEKVRHCYHGVYGAPLKGAPLLNPPPTKLSKTTQPVVLLPNRSASRPSLPPQPTGAFLAAGVLVLHGGSGGRVPRGDSSGRVPCGGGSSAAAWGR